MTPARRSPRPLELALGRLQEEWRPQSLLAAVQSVWRDAVGVSIAQHAQPVSERGGVLTVSCSASVWAQELDLMSPTIIERINEAIAEGTIARLRCVATPARDD